MARFLKRRWFWSILLLVLAVAGYFYLTARPQIVLLDGSALILRDVRYQVKDSLIHGNFLERMLADKISNGGLSIGGFTLKPPYKVFSTGVYVIFDLKGKDEETEQELRSSLEDISQYQLVFWGDDGFVYGGEMEFWSTPPDKTLILNTGFRFPRTSTNLHFRILKMDQHTDSYEEIAGFVVKNPSPAVPAAWVVSDFPAKVTNGVYTAVLEDVQVKNALLDLLAGENTPLTKLSFQLLVDGKPTPSATTRRVFISDATTNSFEGSYVGGWRKRWRHTETDVDSPDPTLPWKVRWQLTLPPNLSETNQITIHLPNDLDGPKEAESNGLIIDYRSMSLGNVLVKPRDSSRKVIPVLLHTKNHQGEIVSQKEIRIYEQAYGHFALRWEPGKIQFPIDLTFAWAEKAEFEFTVKPRLVKEFTELPSIAE